MCLPGLIKMYKSKGSLTKQPEHLIGLKKDSLAKAKPIKSSIIIFSDNKAKV